MSRRSISVSWLLAVATPDHHRESGQRDQAQHGQLRATAAKHAEHQCDKKEGSEGKSTVRCTVDHEQHRENGRKKLKYGQARILKPQIEPEAENDKKYGNYSRNDRASIEKRPAVNFALRVKDGQHEQVQDGENTGQHEPAQSQVLLELVAYR